MAIIGKIRKHSGLAVIIVGVAIAAFVIGDFSKKSNRGSNNIGSVNGTSISYADFNREVDKATENQKENSGTDKIGEEETYTIRQTIWATMVKDLVMGKELDELGMTVSPEELFDQVQGKNPHRYILQYFKDPKTGQYSPELVINYLKNLDQMEPKAKEQWLQFEKAIKDDRIQTKFNNLFTKAYYMPKAFLKQEYINEKQMMQLRVVSPPLTQIADSAVRLTDADYISFYEKNKAIFWQEEASRSVDYVVFEVKPSETDKKKIKEDVESMYQEFTLTNTVPEFVNANSDKKYDSTFVKKGVLPQPVDSLIFASAPGKYFPPFEFNSSWYMAKLLDTQERPDSMTASQILISYQGTVLAQNNKNITRTKEQAEKIADSLMTVLKKDPARFSEIARTLSDYPTAKDDGGELKAILDGEPNFSIFFNAGLTMKPGEMKIVHTGIGEAIFKLNSKTKPIKKVKVALLVRNIEPSNQTYQDTYSKASAFAGQYRTPEAFEKASNEQGLQKRSAMSIREMDNNVMTLQPARELVRWAFNETTKIGDVSPVFDMTGKYVVAILKGVMDKGLIPLDKVKDRLEQNVRNQKKIEMLSERVAKAMETNKDLYFLAGEFSAKVDTVGLAFSGYSPTAIGREFELVGEISDYKPATLNGPLMGKYGVFVVHVDDIIPPQPTQDYMQILNQFQSSFNNKVTTALYESLRKAAVIKDNRRNFY